MKSSATEERRWGAKTASERRVERRAAIMRAAISVFGEIGYRNSSVKAICAAAGLTERYFYESFQNSEDLLQACFQEVTQGLFAKTRTAALAREGSPLDRVHAGLLVYFGELRRNPSAARVFLVEMSSVSLASDALVSKSLERFGLLLMEVLHGDAIESRTYSPLLLRGVIGGGLHIAQGWIASGYKAPIEDVAALALRLYALLEKP